MSEAIERLQDCFVKAEWNVLKEGNILHTLTETVTAYIKFCQGVWIPSKSVTKYSKAVGVTRQSRLKSKLKTKHFKPNPVIQNFLTKLRETYTKQSGMLKSTEGSFRKEACIQQLNRHMVQH